MVKKTKTRLIQAMSTILAPINILNSYFMSSISPLCMQLSQNREHVRMMKLAIIMLYKVRKSFIQNIVDRRDSRNTNTFSGLSLLESYELSTIAFFEGFADFNNFWRNYCRADWIQRLSYPSASKRSTLTVVSCMEQTIYISKLNL